MESNEKHALSNTHAGAVTALSTYSDLRAVHQQQIESIPAWQHAEIHKQSGNVRERALPHVDASTPLTTSSSELAATVEVTQAPPMKSSVERKRWFVIAMVNQLPRNHSRRRKTPPSTPMAARSTAAQPYMVVEAIATQIVNDHDVCGKVVRDLKVQPATGVNGDAESLWEELGAEAYCPSPLQTLLKDVVRDFLRRQLQTLPRQVQLMHQLKWSLETGKVGSAGVAPSMRDGAGLAGCPDADLFVPVRAVWELALDDYVDELVASA